MSKRKKDHVETEEPASLIKHDWRFLLLLFLVALTLRLAYWHELRQQPDYAAPWIDAAYHDVWARHIAFDKWELPDGMSDPKINQYPYFRPPGYPLFLAALYKISGGSYHAPRLMQMALGLLNLFLVYGLVGQFTGRRASRIAAAWTALYPVSIYFEGELLAATCLTTMILIALVLSIRWQSTQAPKYAWSLGIVAGLICITRPNYLLMMPVMICCFWWSHRPIRGLTLAKEVVPLVVGMFLVIAPITLRNTLVASDAVLITSNAGINLYIGNHHQADGFSAIIPDLGPIAGLQGWTSFDYPLLIEGVSMRQGRPFKASELSRYFSGLAYHEIRQYPAHTIKLWFKKAAHFWNPKEISNNKEVDIAIDQSAFIGWLPGFGWLLFVCSIGFVCWWKNARLKVQPLLLYSACWILITFVSFVPFFVNGRFRAPIIPLLAIFAGFGIERLTLSKTKMTFSWIVPLSVLILLAITAKSYQPNSATWHYHQGIAFETRAQFDQAIDAYMEALRTDPTFADAALKLGNIYYGQGRFQLAQQHWEQARKMKSSAEVLNNMAWLMATSRESSLRDPAKAVQYAEQAVALTHRKDAGKLDTLAVALKSSGRLTDSYQIFSEAIARAQADQNQELVDDLRQRRDEI